MGFEHFEVRSAHNDPTPAARYEEIAPAKRFVGDLIRVVQPSVASDYAGLGHGYSANRMPWNMNVSTDALMSVWLNVTLVSALVLECSWERGEIAAASLQTSQKR